MSKPIKLSDKDKAWASQGKMPKRTRASRQIRKLFLIVCEGIRTEPYYFESIKKLLPPNLVLLEVKGEGANTLSLVERARQIRDERKPGGYPFDQVWIIFDRDSFPPDAFDNAIRSAEADGMQCAWSNEAFELWYVLHFEYRNTPTSRNDFQAIISRYIGERYHKNSPDMYHKLSRCGNQKQAIAWARRLFDDFKDRQISPSQSNPCTIVYQLIEELNKYLPPDPNLNHK